MTIDRMKWREEVKNLSDDELDDELQRPTGIWDKEVLREALRRILKKPNTQSKQKEK